MAAIEKSLYKIDLNGKTVVVRAPNLLACKQYALAQTGFKATKAKADDVVDFMATGAKVDEIGVAGEVADETPTKK